MLRPESSERSCPTHGDIAPIAIGPVRYEALVQTSPAWQATLSKHYPLAQKGLQARCLCAPFEGDLRRLTIRRYSDGVLGLARFPDTGMEHSPRCRFHGESVASSGPSEYTSALKEIPGGILVCIPLGLQITEPAAASGCERWIESGHAVRNGRMSLLGLLHLLWHQSALHTWWPRMRGKRHPGLVMHLLHRAADEILCNGRNLSGSLMLGLPPKIRTQAHERQESIYWRALDQRQRLLCVAPLSRHSPQSEVRMREILTSPMYGAMPWLKLPDGLWDATVRRFPNAIAHWRSGGTVVFIAQIEPQAMHGAGSVSAHVVGISLLALSPQWIPVDSFHELAVCTALVDQDRVFVKPLRFDAQEEAVLPDFVLRDTANPKGTPMEVWGRTDTDYKNRQKEKRNYYAKNYGAENWWQWNAANNEPMPSFPPRSAMVAF